MSESAFLEDPMQTDGGDETQSTQQATQETQQMSQRDVRVDDHIWGMLIPCNSILQRVDFQKVKVIYNVGRNADNIKGGNDIIFPGRKISECLLLPAIDAMCACSDRPTRLWRRQLPLPDRVGRQQRQGIRSQGHRPLEQWHLRERVYPGRHAAVLTAGHADQPAAHRQEHVPTAPRRKRDLIRELAAAARPSSGRGLSYVPLSVIVLSALTRAQASYFGIWPRRRR